MVKFDCRRTITSLIAFLLLSSSLVAGEERCQRNGERVPKMGDVLAHDSATSFIKLGSRSPYSHMAVVGEKVPGKNDYYVYESPQGRSYLSSWIRRGGNRYSVYRPKVALTEEEQRSIVEHAKTSMKNPYDGNYNSDVSIWGGLNMSQNYCSKNVYYAYHKALGVTLGKTQTPRELIDGLVRKGYPRGGLELLADKKNMSLDAKLITPVEVTQDSYLCKVGSYSDFGSGELPAYLTDAQLKAIATGIAKKYGFTGSTRSSSPGYYFGSPPGRSTRTSDKKHWFNDGDPNSFPGEGILIDLFRK